MSEAPPAARAASPFSPRAALMLVVLGALVFVALLYMIGSGMTGGTTNDGGGHADGRGLNGYAAFSRYLDRRGFTVRRSRNPGALESAGLLVLTPPARADGAEIDRIVSARRTVGPTLIVTPKWVAKPAPARTKGAKRGWVRLTGTESPAWPGFLDDVSVSVELIGDGKRATWASGALEGPLPDARRVQSGTGARLVPLVVGKADGRILAAYVADGGAYRALEGIAQTPPPRGNDTELHPIVLVFEPDLLDNYGMASLANARLAERLASAATAGGERRVTFDLTQSGHARAPNLLTLAFTPPFLAATLCLLLAAVAVGWRAFLRFGPPRAGQRAIAFGKRALVANTAGLIRRSRRLHLLTRPYAARVRDRIMRALALPQADAADTEAAIDRALAARSPGAPLFSATAARLRAARSPHDIVQAAQDLRALERILIR
jgi:hypothetical protein